MSFTTYSKGSHSNHTTLPSITLPIRALQVYSSKVDEINAYLEIA